jgi:hypothetical protein
MTPGVPRVEARAAEGQSQAIVAGRATRDDATTRRR